jgi:peptide/nickel transport system substrate-binding protein
MSRKLFFALASVFVIASLMLGACSPSATSTATKAPTEEPASPTESPTEAPMTEEPAQPASTERRGGWLDEIDVSVVAAESALSQVDADAIDIYSYQLASGDLPAIKDSGLNYTASYGGSYSLMFNPAVFTDATKLNPFSDRKIREAMNWLIDRNYINQEIYGGGSLPKFFAITTQLVDYTNVVDVARSLEAKYAYSLEKAEVAISAEMEALGATKGADGKYQFNGEPVTIIFLIRPDGDGTRKPMGDYVANQLEAVGFTVDRQYKTSSEAAPIWRGSDPKEGLWHIYTAGWLPSGLTRDEKNSFQQMYLPNSSQGVQPFLSNTSPDADFQQVGDDLANANFSTAQERRALLARAMELSLQDSLQVWMIEQLAYSVYDHDVQVTYDLAAGIEAAYMGPSNLRFVDAEGGQMKVGTNDLFTEPWNTVSGSNWVWDGFVQKATASGTDLTAAGGIMGDPYTGLAWPQRIASAEVTAQTGLPITQSLGWVNLKFEDQIQVPSDAFVDWDASAQKFITAGEKFPDGSTSKIRSVVVYPADLFETVKWHDGSALSVADFLMPFIVFFDRANPDSAIFDEAAVPNVEFFKSYFKGLRITSTDPLTVEYYSDLYYDDAELDVQTLWPNSAWGLNGENAWQILAVSNLAESNGELAYSADKADIAQVEQISWVGGPSLEVLKKYLDQAAGESYIPYEATLGQYLTAEEAAARYANFQKWYEDHGHFWVGTGPYFLDKVFTTEKSLVLKNNVEFPDKADMWASFSSPKLAEVSLDGPAQVKIGSEAVFNLEVTFLGEAYSAADIKQVKYLVYDATGALVGSGEATAVADGLFEVTLGSDLTSKLAAGATRIEVIVVPIPVAIPAFTLLDFVVIP